jgi:sugar/nucleoside kinase (ribokinase family)
MNKKKQIVGLGSALVDILIRESDDFIKDTGVAKGGMMLVDTTTIDRLVENSSAVPAIVPGGSACNTATGVAQLGGEALFVGKRGRDPLGDLFESELKKKGVSPGLFLSSAPTGKVLSIITPDAQRTMLTFLGASEKTRPEDMTPDLFKRAGIVHIEGYLLFNPDLMVAALKAAKQAGAKISLDLASFTVVDAAGDLLKTIVADYVDILIANEDEGRAFAGNKGDEAVLETLAANVETAVLKLGPRGSLISSGGKCVRVLPVEGGGIVDTTGAGDLWASGFLFGMVSDYPLDVCGRIASACGYEVCRVIGASIPSDGWGRIRAMISG